MKKNSLEDLFKESFENFEPEVSSGVWTKIQTAIKATGVGVVVKSLLKKVGSKTIFAVISASLVLITTFYFINIKGDKKVEKSEDKKVIVPDISTPVMVVQPDLNKVSETNKEEIPAAKTEPEHKIEASTKVARVLKEDRVIDSLKKEVSDNFSSITKYSEFSPNADGSNDEFIFQSKNISTMKITIYDKDANIVYSYEGIDGKWDGKNLRGEKVNEGYYLYLITAQGVGGKKYDQKGKVKLTR